MRTVLYWAISVTYRILGDTRCTDVSKTDASHRSSPIAIGPAVGSTTHIETIDLALTRSCALLDRLRCRLEHHCPQLWMLHDALFVILVKYQGLQFRSAGQSVSIRQVTTTRTARYRLVPPKSTVGGRFRPSMVDCAPTGKRSHKERLSTVEARLDVLETSLEELYQGQGRLLGVESSQEEAESRIDRVESLVDRLTEDTKDFVRHLHEVVAELTAKVTVLTRTLNAGGNNAGAAPP
ncbi:hypothetical protein BHM03_00060554 [Ensete ventricosum]|nr:hypothetical protein BHM03_00060554 [Ensete ventricosum]